jgi:hypothetical protein
MLNLVVRKVTTRLQKVKFDKAMKSLSTAYTHSRPIMISCLHVFLGSKCCPTLIDNSCIRVRLAILETLHSFLWYEKIALPLDVQQLLIKRAPAANKTCTSC